MTEGRYYPPGYTDEQKAMLDTQIERARQFREREVTITLTGEEWQTVLGALYRALLADAETVGKADRGELPEDDETDPLMMLDVLSRTHVVRAKLHELMHQGEDQATWTADEEEA